MATEIASSTSSVSLPAVTVPVAQQPVADKTAAEAPQQQTEQSQKPQVAKKQDGYGPGKSLDQVVKDVAQMVRRDLNFTIDKDSGVTVVKVIDPVTKEVVRQIPPEEMLALARRLTEMSQEEPVSGESAKGLFMATRV